MKKTLRFLFHPELGRSFEISSRNRRLLAQQWRELIVPAARSDWRWRDAFSRERRVPGAVGVTLILSAASGLVWIVFGLLGREAAGAELLPMDFFTGEDGATEKVLGFLFNLAKDATPALSQMMMAFNLGILVLAGFLLVYHTIAGTVATAAEGRWGFGSWEIVRIVVAVALLVPLPGSGLNGGQHVVLGLAKMGAGFADRIWTPMQTNVITGREIIVPHANSVARRVAIVGALSAETCRYVANANNPGELMVQIRKDNRKTAAVTHYDGWEKGKRVTKDLCGAIVFEGLGKTRVYGGYAVFEEAKTPEARASRAHKAALESVLPTLQEVAKEFGERFVGGAVGEDLPDVAERLEAAGVVDKYEKELTAGLGEAQIEAQQGLVASVVATAGDRGWLGAASIFNVVARRAGNFQLAALNAPRPVGPAENLIKKSALADAAVRALAVNLAGSRLYGAVAAAEALGSDDEGTGKRGRINSIFQWLDFDLTVVADSGNPIADLSSMGHTLISMAMGAMVGLAGVGAVSGLLVPSLWVMLDGFIGTVLGIMLVAGAMLAYLVPAIPFIRFLFGILGWVLSVVEAVLAVSVFAAAHVTRGEGNGLATSATRQGWLFLPGLLLRPVLMLFGLLLGYFTAVVMIKLFSDIWLPYLASSRESGGLGLVGFIAMLALYTFVAFGLLNGGFKLIDILPDAVLSWIGARAGGGDGGADRVGSATTAGFGRLAALRIGRLR